MATLKTSDGVRLTKFDHYTDIETQNIILFLGPNTNGKGWRFQVTHSNKRQLIGDFVVFTTKEIKTRLRDLAKHEIRVLGITPPLFPTSSGDTPDKVPVGLVRIPQNRLRQTRKPKVDALAQSMKTLGLRSPITVFEPNEDTRELSVVLVAGLHRLEAAKLLGWSEIDCCFIHQDSDFDELDRALWEIDENLIRAELSEIEIAEHHKRRKEILEAKGLVATHGGDRASAQNAQLKSYADDASEKLGVHPSTVRRAVKRANKIDDAVKDRIKAVRPDAPAVELDAVAKLDSKDQHRVVVAVEKGEAESFREASAGLGLASAEVVQLFEPPPKPDRQKIEIDKIVEAIRLINDKAKYGEPNTFFAHADDGVIRDIDDVAEYLRMLQQTYNRR